MNETTKQEAAKYLTDLMATIQMAYYNGAVTLPECGDTTWANIGRLVVHETGKTGVSIDLYDLWDDGLPECPDLTFDTLCPADGKPIHQHAFCVSYDPEWEEHPLLLQCDDATDDEFDGSFDLTTDYIPEQTMRSIATWIESLLPSNNETEK